MINYDFQKYNSGFLFKTASHIEKLVQTNPLIVLAYAINWMRLETSIGKFFVQKNGRPTKPLRLLIALAMLKFYFDFSDERTVEQWSENPFFQAFAGRQSYTTEPPRSPSQLSKFRSRIGKEGIEIIFEESARVHGPSALEKEVIGDTTVQEKYTKYPTDAKLANKIIDGPLLCEACCSRLTR
jgi:IS5 family transposase